MGEMTRPAVQSLLCAVSYRWHQGCLAIQSQRPCQGVTRHIRPQEFCGQKQVMNLRARGILHLRLQRGRDDQSQHVVIDARSAGNTSQTPAESVHWSSFSLRAVSASFVKPSRRRSQRVTPTLSPIENFLSN